MTRSISEALVIMKALVPILSDVSNPFLRNLADVAIAPWASATLGMVLHLDTLPGLQVSSLCGLTLYQAESSLRAGLCLSHPGTASP